MDISILRALDFRCPLTELLRLWWVTDGTSNA